MAIHDEAHVDSHNVCHYPLCYEFRLQTAAYCALHELLWIAHNGEQSVAAPFTATSPYYQWRRTWPKPGLFDDKG